MPDQGSLLGSPAARVTFVMSCLFATTGVIMVFLPRWLEAERGLTGAQIGAVLSLAQVARVFTGPAIAHWADSVHDRRTPLRWLSIAAWLAYAAFFFLAQGFWPLLAVGFLALSFSSGMTPLVEGATLRSTAQGRMSYGVARGIGSVAFILANIAGGLAVAKFGPGATVAWVLCGLAGVIGASWLALKRDPRPAAPPMQAHDSLRGLLKSRRFVIVIASCGLIQSAHAFYYGFSTLVWRGQGIPADTVGYLWAMGVAVEVAFLWSLTPIERRISPEALIMIGAVAAVVRWVFMGFGPIGWVLWPLQALHALSFAAAHVGAMRLIFREAPDHSAAMAQTLYAIMTGGILMGAATLLSGALYDSSGAGGYWAMAAQALAGGLLGTLLFRPQSRPPAATPH